MGGMTLRRTELEWLALHFPEMEHLPDRGILEGHLRFCAAFDRATGKLTRGDSAKLRAMDTFLCDAFAVKVDLQEVGVNGWPQAYEVGGRCEAIAQRNQCPMIDLHLFDNGMFCLGLDYAPARNMTLQRFVEELMIPFLYRLAYTDRHGLEAARAHLWGEYAHGEQGHREYQQEILAIAAHSPGRNQACPCDSGRKYKKCHYDEVEAVKRILRVP